MAFTFLKPKQQKTIKKAQKTIEPERDEEDIGYVHVDPGPADIENTQKFADAMLSIVMQYKDVLCAKQKQMQYKNDYGLLVDNGWKNEKRYFVKNLVLVNRDIKDSIVAIVSHNDQSWYDKTIFNYASNALLLFYCINKKWGVKSCNSGIYHQYSDYKKYERKAEKWFTIEHLFDSLTRAYLQDGKVLFVDPLVESKFIDDIGIIIDAFLLKINDNKKNAVISKSVSPVEYERKIANKLKELDFNARVTKGSGDQGADVLANKNGVKFAIQCKMHSKPVGNKAVQEANTARDFYKCDYAVVVTNAGYTKSARQAANACNVILLNENQLDKLDKYTK